MNSAKLSHFKQSTSPLHKSGRIVFLLLVLSLPVALVGAEEPADSVKKKSGTLIVLPVIAYTPETKLVLGAAGFYYFKPSEQAIATSAARLLAVYTTKKQFQLQATSDIYLGHGEKRVSSEMSYTKFVDSFWGIGNALPDSAEEIYESRRIILYLRGQTELTAHLQGGLLWDFAYQTIVETEPGRLLSSGTITGSNGGTISGVGPVLNYDSRDNVFSPSMGNYSELILTMYPKFLGDDFGFSSLVLDVRQFLPVTETSVLALQIYSRFSSNGTPFQKLSQLGGSNRMRGFYEGRYRDQHMIELQAEYRIPLFWRLGAVAFAGTGDVASTVGKFSTGTLKFAGGVGGRYAINREDKVNLRVDLAFAQGDTSIYFTIEEAF